MSSTQTQNFDNRRAKGLVKYRDSKVYGEMKFRILKFPGKLIKLAEKLSLSQEQFAKRVKMQQTGMHRMMKGEQRPYLDQAFLIAKEAGVSLDWLADDRYDEEPPAPPDERERQVREFAAKYGWDEVYWRFIAGGGEGPKIAGPGGIDPLKPRAMPRGEEYGPSKKPPHHKGNDHSSES